MRQPVVSPTNAANDAAILILPAPLCSVRTTVITRNSSHLPTLSPADVIHVKQKSRPTDTRDSKSVGMPRMLCF